MVTFSPLPISCSPLAAVSAWQEWRDSNPQPLVLETGALAIELHSSGSGYGEPKGPPRRCHALYRLRLQGRLGAEYGGIWVKSEGCWSG